MGGPRWWADGRGAGWKLVAGGTGQRGRRHQLCSIVVGTERTAGCITSPSTSRHPCGMPPYFGPLAPPPGTPRRAAYGGGGGRQGGGGRVGWQGGREAGREGRQGGRGAVVERTVAAAQYRMCCMLERTWSAQAPWICVLTLQAPVPRPGAQRA